MVLLMTNSFNPFLLVVLCSFIIAQYPPTVVQQSDVLAPGDGSSGYGFGPIGMTMDATGTLYFTESQSIRMTNFSVVLTVSGPYTIPQGTYNCASGIAVDSKGNLIVADSLNNAIKRIDINGRVSTIGTVGTSVTIGKSKSGTSQVSTLVTGFLPLNIAFDSSSTLYVGDITNSLVKKVFPNGTVVTLAYIASPFGMAVDLNGNVYVGGSLANVYKITPAGSVSLLAGNGVRSYVDGTGSLAEFNYPYPGSVDDNGNVYIPDYVNNRIRKITPAGVVTTIAGSGAATSIDGQGTSASFNGPLDVKIDSVGNLIVVDNTGCKVRKLSPSGAVTTIAGTGTCSSVDGQGTSASFNQPIGLALDGNGNIFVSEYNGCKIRVINSANYVTTLTGFNGCGVTINGDLFVGQFNNLYGLAFDQNTGNLCVSDYGNNAIRKISISMSKSVSSSSFNSPTGVAVDSTGNIFVADQLNHMIKVINSTGVVSLLAGSGIASFANGNGTLASFNSPFGVALDVYGNVIVADTGNNMIRNVTKTGNVTTIAGSGAAGWIDGQGTNSTLNAPMGVSVDSSNRVFIADSLNNCVRVINSSGYLNTLYFGRGFNLVLNAPQGILVAPNGDLFIADSGNKRIRNVPASLLVGRI